MLFPHFHHFILQPNQFTTFIGGDGLVTYYQMIYYIKYDSGTLLSSMNYPTGEYIWMTDGNGSFAIVMKWINDYIYNIEDIVPGIFTYFIFFTWLMASSIMYYLLRAFNVHKWIAIIAAPIIILMSPMMPRFINHVSQPFPFMIPLSILWFIRKTRVLKLEKRDILLALVYLFFFLNNSYGGAISLGIGLISSIVYIFLANKRSISKGMALSFVAPVLTIVLATFIIMKAGDIYDDRLDIQWGFFAYNAEISGYFYPHFSLLRDFLNNFVKVADQGYEQAMNLGLIPALIAIYYFIRLIFKKKPFALGIHHRSLFIGAFLMFIFASNSNYMPFLDDLIEEHMGALIMFKSSARFGWPMYYVVAILACRWLSHLQDHIKTEVKYLPIAIVFVPLLLWYLESNYFLNQSEMETRHDNPFIHDYAQKTYKVAEEYQLDTTQYQAMFMLPHVQAWHDNLMTHNNFYTEFTGMLLSAHTGIPWINSKLSRNSTGATFRNTQMISSSLIKRTLRNMFPNDKDILLVEGREDRPLKHGEKYLKGLGELVYKDEDVSFYRLKVKDLKEAYVFNRTKERMLSDSIASPRYEFKVEHFDEDAVHVFYGDGAKTVTKGRKAKLETYAISVPEDRWYEFSAWNYEDGREYGSIEWFIHVKNQDYDNNVFVPARECRDIYGSWIRANKEFLLPKGNNEITISYSCRKEMYVDQLTIRDLQDTIIYKAPEEEFTLLNGYIMD